MSDLQYRPDNDRLLYVTETGGDALMRECCCDSCSDTVACHRYDACCDDNTGYDDLLTNPHYIVISDSYYTTLSDPNCVVVNSCCYCSHDSTTTLGPTKSSGVTASSNSTCHQCLDSEGISCTFCNGCNDCDPPLPNDYNMSFSGITSSVSAYWDNIQAWHDGAMEEINGSREGAEHPWPLIHAGPTFTEPECTWRMSTHSISHVAPGLIIYFHECGSSHLARLAYGAGAWSLAITSCYTGTPYTAVFENTSSTACNPTGTYTLKSGTSLFTAGTAVIS